VAALTALGSVSERLGPHVRWAAFLAAHAGCGRASVAMEVAREELTVLPPE
jgi:hypothetical protein